MAERELLSRTRNFAYDVYRMVTKIRIDVYNKQIIEQLIDSAFSTAANYIASQRGKSKRDSLNKIKIVLEETDEANFWLQVFYDLQLSITAENIRLIKESEELISIFVAISNKLSD